MTPHASPGGAALAVSCRLDSGTLCLELVVRNLEAEPIHVRTHPDDGTREGVLDGRAYVTIDPEEGLLHVSLIDPPAPSDRTVTYAILSLSTRIEADGEHHWTIHVPVPVTEWNPYEPSSDGLECDEIVLDRAAVITGWFPESGMSWASPGPRPGTRWTQGDPYRSLSTIVELPVGVLGRVPAPPRP